MMIDLAHNGTATSCEAAASVFNVAGRQRALLIAYYRARGPAGATDDEAQQALDMPGNTQRPRRRELQRAGLVRDSGRRQRTRSGRPAVIWIAADAMPARDKPGASQPGQSCKRCGGTKFVDFCIHRGQSIRRDCRKCGQTLCFPVWYGRKTAGISEQKAGECGGNSDQR